MMLQSFALVAMMFVGQLSPVHTLVSAEPGAATATVQVMSVQRMTPKTEKILIENHAAPHWQLSIEEAWQAYYDQELVIIEIAPEEHYELRYDGGQLEVIFDEL